MKNIKLRIVYLILGAALLLFALFMLAVNLIIPAHFVSEAKKALISEAQYQNRTIPYTDDEPIYDEGEDEGNFFTPSIVFLELDDGYRPNTWNRDTYRLEIKLLEYCAGRDIALNQCYTFKTDKHHLIFMSVEEEQDDWEKPYDHVHRHRPNHPLYCDAELGVLWGAAGDLLRHVPAGLPVWP